MRRRQDEEEQRRKSEEAAVARQSAGTEKTDGDKSETASIRSAGNDKIMGLGLSTCFYFRTLGNLQIKSVHID